MTTQYVVRGINGDADVCSQCGKRGLKRVVWLAPIDSDSCAGEAAPYGVDCAAALLFPGHTFSSKLRAESAIKVQLEKAVWARIHGIHATMPLYQNRRVLPEFVGVDDAQAALNAKIEKYPITAYAAGRISLMKAAQYL